MKIAITGSSGLIGSRLLEHFGAKKQNLIRLVRTKCTNVNTIFWDPKRKVIDKSKLEDIDVFIHLAGKNISEGRWSPKLKTEIYQSRVETTRFLCKNLAQLKNPPKLLISASGVGIYGDTGDQIVEEDHCLGTGFLSKVCVQWEKACASAIKANIRVVFVRLGAVLSKDGGALKRMLPFYSLGLGGKIGTGNQFVSFVSLEDVVHAIGFIIEHPNIQGAVNLAAPKSIRQKQFRLILGQGVKRPAFVPLPKIAVKILFGEMGHTLLLESCRAVPKKLLNEGFRFLHPSLEQALEFELKRETRLG